MHTDVLIVGQGLCGTHLSWQLHKEGRSFIVVDDGAPNASSKVAAGIINPVTGRRYQRTWMAETLLDFAQQAYTELGNYLGEPLLAKKTIIDFFPSPDSRNAFVAHLTENDTYLRSCPDQNRFNVFFDYPFGCGEIHPAFVVNVGALLQQWRTKLLHDNRLMEERFEADELVVKEDGVQYRHITANKVIFCDGIASARNPWFQRLPFSANKGEALIIRCEGLPTDHIFKRGSLLAPLQQPGHFWVGSNYEWEFSDTAPSAKFYAAATGLLNEWLKQPYTVVAHKAAVRPATLERRPFVGFHPLYPAIGILNGMGTKGTSLAAFFAHQLVQHLVHGFPLTPQADVHRFNRILSG